MRRLRPSLLALLLVFAACTSPGTTSSKHQSVAVAMGTATYQGAWSAGGFGVALASQGSAVLWVTGTTTFGMRAYANGQSVQVRVGLGNPPSTVQLGRCACPQDVTLAKDLSTDPHIVSVVNTSTRLLVIQSWTIDGGGRFVRVAAGNDALHRTVSPGAPLEFYVRNVSLLAVDYVPTGAVLRVRLNDRPGGYLIKTPSAASPSPSVSSSAGGSSSAGSASPSPSSPSPSSSPSGSGGPARSVIAWGLPGGLEKVTVEVVHGSLQLLDVAMFEPPRRGTPQVMPTDDASRADLLAVFGDSVGDGQLSLGFTKDSDGFPERLAGLRGWRLAVIASAGASATCFGMRNVGSVIAADPQRVIVAFGTDDMIPGPGSDGCASNVGEFSHAMNAILATLGRGLPGVRIYLEAILPTPGVADALRAKWNAALRRIGQGHHVPVIDPSGVLNLRTDFGGRYPNDRGAQKIATFWDRALGTTAP